MEDLVDNGAHSDDDGNHVLVHSGIPQLSKFAKVKSVVIENRRHVDVQSLKAVALLFVVENDGEGLKKRIAELI